MGVFSIKLQLHPHPLLLPLPSSPGCCLKRARGLLETWRWESGAGWGGVHCAGGFFVGGGEMELVRYLC